MEGRMARARQFAQHRSLTARFNSNSSTCVISYSAPSPGRKGVPAVPESLVGAGHCSVGGKAGRREGDPGRRE